MKRAALTGASLARYLYPLAAAPPAQQTLRRTAMTPPTSPPDPAQEDAKWEAYPRTVLEFRGPPLLRVDLREPLDEGARTALRERVGGAPFGVFTAENPAGEHAEDAPSEGEESRRERSNARRTSRLEEELTRDGVHFVQLDGVSPDGSYRERCVAALLAREEAWALARRFAQLALFWFDGRRFWLLPVIADKPPHPLP